MKLTFLNLWERPLRMLWRVESGERCSYLVGTAHFFPYSFERSIHRLLNRVDRVLLEGPLDRASMNRVGEYGRTGDAEELVNALPTEVIQAIDRELSRRLDGSGEIDLYPLFQPCKPVYFQALTQGVRPWMAFFSIWTTYLGWRYSVDRQAYQVACSLGKPIQALETLEEQLDVLDGIPMERLARQLSEVHRWDEYSEAYKRAYLRGDLPSLLALSGRFPTRTPSVISGRDRILFERMLEVIDKEAAAVFIGAPHIPGVSALLERQGYRIIQGLP